MIRRLIGNALLLAVLLAGALCTSGFAQNSNGTIRGTVTDSTGAVLPNATVVLVNVGTAEQVTQPTNKDGYYTFTDLSPSQYIVKVSAQAFDTWEGRLTLRVSQEAVINASLKPGSAKETVTVTDVTPVLDAGDATLSDVKESTRIDTLPLQSSNFLNVLNFSPGVVSGSYAGQGGGYTRVNGITGGSMTYQIDGQSANDRYTNELQATPQALQTIQELKVTTSNGSAEYGTPGVVDVVTKSGTNELHGQVHELYQTGGFEAKTFHQAATIPHLVHNEFGGQVGGPVLLPKLYNGKNKTFFYFNVEKQIQHKLDSDLELLPQKNWLQGDFSDYVDYNGNPVKIYDPATTTVDNTGTYPVYRRTQFQNNQIPTGRFNGPAAKVAQMVIQANAVPNVNVNSAGQVNVAEWGGGYDWENPSAGAVDDIMRYTGKVDQLFGKNLLSARYTYINEPQTLPDNRGNSGVYMNPRLQQNSGHNGVLSYTTPFGASAINEARIGIQLFNQYTGPQPIPGLFQELGLPVYPEAIGWPGIYWWDDAQPNISVIDRDNPKQAPNQNVSATDSFSWTRGKHEVKVGFQVVNTRLDTEEAQNPGGNYSFGGVFTGLQDPSGPVDALPPLADAGAGIADMLIGEVDGAYLEVVPVLHTRQTDYDAYVQDNWKLSPRLTLNLGLRYEYWSPYDDPGGLATNLAMNPSSAGNCSVQTSLTGNSSPTPCVGANTYPLAPWFSQSQPLAVIPDHGSSQDPNLINAAVAAGLPLEKASAAGYPQSMWNMPKNNWAPRLGFAYQVNDKTVVRAGYGIYYWTMPLVQYHQNTRDNVPWTINTANWEDNAYAYSCSYSSGLYGSTCPNETTWPVGGPAYPTVERTWGTPFISTSGITVSNSGGWGIAAWDPNYKAQQAQEWNLTVERALPGNWGLALSYLGNRATHLVNYDPINAALPRELGPGAAAQSWQRRPMPNFSPSGTSAMDEFVFSGYGNHHEGRAELKHTFKGSFTLQTYVTYGKTLTTSEGTLKSFGGLEVHPAVLTNNAPLYKRLRDIYAPDSELAADSVGFNGHYELPFGKGKPILANAGRLANDIVGGWNTSAFFLWRSGLPFSPCYESQPSGACANIILAPGNNNRGILPRGSRTASEWFDARVWDPTKTAYAGEPFEYRNTLDPLSVDFLNGIPRNYMSGPTFWNADGTIYKVTPIGERMKFNLEMQVFNLFNHVDLALPSTTPGSGGGIISQGLGQSRLLQFQGKITF
jgi:outer membrane receptor protein involved in Fe transport